MIQPPHDVFCVLPWSSLHVAMNGDAYPCCFSDVDHPVGSTREQSLAEIWNSGRMNAVRKAMAEGRPNPICEKCYEQEANGFASLRNTANSNFTRQVPFAAETRPDGSVPRMNLVYLDIRFSNVCNYRCRTCGPGASTAWYRDSDPDPRFVRAIKPKESTADLIAELVPLLPQIEQIYFAGGEPSVTREHYLILEKLLEAGRTDLRISYSTNFSTLRFAHWNLLDMWSRFSDITVGASLDGSGARGDYLRKGQQWARVVENRKLQMERCPHVSFRISSTLSNMNCLHLPDFHEEWVNLGLIDCKDIHVNILQDPMHFRLSTLPPHIKERVAERYASHARFVAGHCPGCAPLLNAWKSAVRFMRGDDGSAYLEEFRRNVQSIDKRRGESFAETFPELADMAG